MIASEEKREPLPAPDVYRERLAALNGMQGRDQRRERVFGIAKLLVAALTIGSGVLLLRHFALGAVTAALLVVFVALAIRHEKLLNAIRGRNRVIAFYERGLARLEDRWQGDGETGERFLDPAHPYARDLDIFGDASLFQYLNVARTRAGEETLAKWLLEPASTDEILARQSAVRELQDRLDFREAVSTTGEKVRAGVHPEELAKWGEQGPILSSTATRLMTSAFGLIWVGSLAAWALWGVPEWAVLSTLLNFGYSHLIYERRVRAAGTIEKAEGDLRLLAELLAIFEQERVEGTKLNALQNALLTQSIAPSVAVRRLARIVDVIQQRDNVIAKTFDPVTFWSAQLIFMAETWQREYGPAIRAWIATVGELEALNSLAALSYEHPMYAAPDILPDAPHFEATGLAHPLLPLAGAVENDVLLDGSNRVMILSGPNMAGKSTFMRSLGVNAVLAQCGAPVRAQSLRMSPLQVAASICILDSLSGGVSRFYAEIRRVKLIVDLANAGMPVLFLLDELLSGTNSHDRLIGTQFVLKSLASRNAIGIVSTHDLALTRIAGEMEGRAFNAHFEDHIEQDRLIFDYKLKAGVVQTSNALELMRAIGLGVEKPLPSVSD